MSDRFEGHQGQKLVLDSRYAPNVQELYALAWIMGDMLRRIEHDMDGTVFWVEAGGKHRPILDLVGRCLSTFDAHMADDVQGMYVPK